MKIWKLTCLLCGVTSTSLVEIQEHVMHVHHYPQTQLKLNTKRSGHDCYVWTMPDGVDWLQATGDRDQGAAQ